MVSLKGNPNIDLFLPGRTGSNRAHVPIRKELHDQPGKQELSPNTSTFACPVLDLSGWSHGALQIFGLNSPLPFQLDAESLPVGDGSVGSWLDGREISCCLAQIFLS